MIVRVNSDETKEEIILKATKKHEHFDQTFDNSLKYTLLYPDYKEVKFVPGTRDVFSLSSYRDAIGKDYKRLVFYLIPVEDVYEVSSDEELEKSPFEQRKTETNTDGLALTDVWDAEDEMLAAAIEESKQLSACDAPTDSDPPDLDKAFEHKLRTFPVEFYTAIEVTRKSTAERALELLQDEEIHPRVLVKFIGEDAVDSGGVTREFFSEFFRSMSTLSRLVRGTFPNITFRHNFEALKCCEYELFGKLVAVALLNGCPGPHFFTSSLAKFLLNIPCKPSLEEVPVDCEFLPLLKEIECSTEEGVFVQKVMEFEERFDMGFTKAIVTMSDKHDLLTACLKHILISSVAEEIYSFKRGLSSFGVYDLLCKYPEAAQNQLVHCTVSLEEAKQCFEPVFSPPGDEHEKEVELVYNWYQFLKAVSKQTLRSNVVELHGWEPDGACQMRVLNLGDILQFGSGSRYPNFKGSLQFNHTNVKPEERLRANTCAIIITLPVNRRYCCSTKEFAQHALEDILNDHGFGLA